jgi:hypothetical protein
MKTPFSKLIVSNFKKDYFLYLMNFIVFYFLKFETPSGIADLTASTVLDVVPHRQL